MQAPIVRIPTRRRRAQKLLLICFGFIFGLVLVELGLRIIGYSYPDFYRPDRARGYSLRPHAAGWYRKEGEAYVVINGAGLRDRPRDYVKPSNTFRIAVLGDSYVEALQVPFEDSFSALLEKDLNDCRAAGTRHVEVINFGVSGYGTAQELITLRTNVWQFAPDLVLLAVTTNNDISDNLRELKKTDQIPYFTWNNEKLLEDDSFLQTPTFRSRTSLAGRAGQWFGDDLRLVQAVQQAAFAIRVKLAERRMKSSEQTAGPAATPQSPATAAELGVDNVVYGEPVESVWRDAWKVTEELIKAMRSEVSSRGARFAVVTLSNPPQDLPDEAAREAFLKRVGGQDIFYPDFRIRDFCRSEGIEVITLAPGMQAFAEQNHLMLHGFGKDLGNGHWNVAGHRHAAEFAAADLCKWLSNASQ